MHFKFPFTVSQVLWTLTFAAQLTLLVVLLGRDRIKRYPWFTASVVLFALRLLIEILLSGRMAPLPMRATFIALADLMAVVGLAVVVEIARRAFSGAKRLHWLIGAVAALAVGGVVLGFWGEWPQLKGISLASPLAIMALMQLFAQKADLLVDVLTIELGLLVVAVGRLYGAGWRSHTQRIVIGLSTTAISWLSVQAIWQIVATRVHPHSQEEYERIISLGGKLVNANKAVYIAVLVWWIVSLWSEEPGTSALGMEAAPAEPVEALPAEPPQILE